MTEHRCGSVHQTPIPAIANRAALHVLAYASQRAVTISPEGLVHVEPVDWAADADLVGVYTASLGVLELSRRLTEDLRHEVHTRQLRPQHRRKRVTSSGQARGSA